MNRDKGVLKAERLAEIAERIDVTPTYRKVAKSGNARYLAVTHQIPKDWRMVEVTASEPNGKIMTLTVRKVD